MKGPRLHIRPIELADANEYVSRLHRHHEPVVGHRFSIGAYEGDRLCGVAIVGRPVAKSYDKLVFIEVTRLCTDGTKNACSALYAAAARAGKALGYLEAQTYLLDSEPGTSARAAGWKPDAEPTGGGQWNRPGDWTNPDQAVLFQRNRTDQPTCAKRRWWRRLNKSHEEQA